MLSKRVLFYLRGSGQVAGCNNLAPEFEMKMFVIYGKRYDIFLGFLNFQEFLGFFTICP